MANLSRSGAGEGLMKQQPVGDSIWGSCHLAGVTLLLSAVDLRLVITFFSKEQVSFNFMAAIPICNDFGAQKIKAATVSPSICHELMGPDAMILVF